MAIHISARLAWHDNGWDGTVCRHPEQNQYCVGFYSYPAQLIAEERDLEWEKSCAGKHCSKVEDGIPPCRYSINAFSSEQITADSSPPEFFGGDADPVHWELPPSTVCVWPYEAMFGDGVKNDQGYFDYGIRRQNANEFFEQIEPEKSLVFYYANYSNPFNEGEEKHYILIGLSRIKSVGPEIFYNNCKPNIVERYAGGFVWQRNITSAYPDEGLRIPYHKYRHNADVLEKIKLIPENSRVCKYGAREIDDDDALGLVEQFLGVVNVLIEIGDTTEDWVKRRSWLLTLIGELWAHRGLYPGMPAVLEVMKFEDAIDHFRSEAVKGEEKTAVADIFKFVEGETEKIPTFDVADPLKAKIRREWKLLEDKSRLLMKEVFPLIALNADQVECILSDKRAENGLTSSLEEIHKNPYVLCEQYVGNDPDDVLSWSMLDRALIPSPDLGGKAYFETNAPERLRSLMVDCLKQQPTHMFYPVPMTLQSVNRRLSYLPDWKQNEFHIRYIDADKEILEGALTFRSEADKQFVYLRTQYEEERYVESVFRGLLDRPNIALKRPVTDAVWRSFLFSENSALASKGRTRYEEAIADQSQACQRVFVRPISVLAGAAGTGKSTVSVAIIKAIKKGHGEGTSVIVLAPTGKAAERLRQIIDKDEALKGAVRTATIHSFLAKHGWLNDNMTFKKTGGQRAESFQTVIIDESSMLDLNLTAALFRCITWQSVQRLILVGDPNQLPPIGRGKVFADLIHYLLKLAPDGVAHLTKNLRLMENEVSGKGTGILRLAGLYCNPLRGSEDRGAKNEEDELRAEEILKSVQEGGDVDNDLRTLYWSTPDDLQKQLLKQIQVDMLHDAKLDEMPARTFELWQKAFESGAEYMQILAPYRSDIDTINVACQMSRNDHRDDPPKMLEGIALFDKVIQVRNRPASNPIIAYNSTSRSTEAVEVYNGEIGFVKPHALDSKTWKQPYSRLKRFQVVFARKPNLMIGYGGSTAQAPNGRWRSEPVEENLELAYAISIHKAQGSEFGRTYVVISAGMLGFLSPELFYTALTRATKHCTLLVQNDVSPILDMRRPERSQLKRINSSLFEFRAVPDEFLLGPWMPEGKIYRTLAADMVRSKSEVIIANILFDREIEFSYEKPLFAPDGTFYLPDFTVRYHGEDYYWEHLGLLEQTEYQQKWDKKRKWYETHFPGKLLITIESADLSQQAAALAKKHFVV